MNILKGGILGVIMHDRSDFCSNSTFTEKIENSCQNLRNFGPENFEDKKEIDQKFFRHVNIKVLNLTTMQSLSHVCYVGKKL